MVIKELSVLEEAVAFMRNFDANLYRDRLGNVEAPIGYIKKGLPNTSYYYEEIIDLPYNIVSRDYTLEEITNYLEGAYDTAVEELEEKLEGEELEKAKSYLPKPVRISMSPEYE